MSQKHCTTPDPDVIPLRIELRDLLRSRLLACVGEILEEELTAALGCARHERTEERRGYRNGKQACRITW